MTSDPKIQRPEIQRPEIRKNRDTGKWTATRPRYGFAPGMESNTKLASHSAAVDWVYRQPQIGTSAFIAELSHPYSDGVASVPTWTPLHYPYLLVGKGNR